MADAPNRDGIEPMVPKESPTFYVECARPVQPHPRHKKWLTTTARATFDKVALVSAALGVLIGLGIALLYVTPALGIYIASFGIFHLLEFVVTARYNKQTVGMNSFLLTNGIEYFLAHTCVLMELGIRWYHNGVPPTSRRPLFIAGLTALIIGQYIRSAAMIQAATSFNHYIQEEKKEDHVLVKTKLYGVMRHPSYFGFFLWEVGSQVVLGNRVSLALLTATLYVYFFQRMRIEEAALLRFFGEEYQVYRDRTWSGLPFYYAK